MIWTGKLWILIRCRFWLHAMRNLYSGSVHRWPEPISMLVYLKRFQSLVFLSRLLDKQSKGCEEVAHEIRTICMHVVCEQRFCLTFLFLIRFHRLSPEWQQSILPIKFMVLTYRPYDGQAEACKPQRERGQYFHSKINETEWKDKRCAKHADIWCIAFQCGRGERGERLTHLFAKRNKRPQMILKTY